MAEADAVEGAAAEVDVTEWPSFELAKCADCGQPLAPRSVAGRRCYGCGCQRLVDADELDETIAQAVFERQRRRLARLSFGPRRVRAAWHNADAVARRAMIRAELAVVTVSRRGGQMDLACVWNTEQAGTDEPEPR